MSILDPASAQALVTSTPLLLIDGSSYLYRAYHALPPLTNSKGQPTGAVLGVVNMLRKLLAEYRPQRVAVVFDARGKTFRDDLFAAYKANRPPMPDDLASQIEPLHEIVRAMGLPLLQIPGVEADDVIGTLARRAAAQGLHTVISTGDKDMAQLVDEHVTLVNTMSNTVLDRAGVIAKFGVPPERIVDYLALIGDSIDNIPGIPKVGPKTAAKWLTEYQDLDHLIAQADAVSGRVGENLRAHLEQLALSRRLATIHCDLELPIEVAALTPAEPDLAALRACYAKLEFNSLLRQLSSEPAGEPALATTVEQPPVEAVYETILDWEHFERWYARLQAAPIFAFDTETTSLKGIQARLVGLSFAVAPQEAAYVPLYHDYLDAPAQLDGAEVLARLKPLLEAPARAKLGQNLKYDQHVLVNHGIALAGIRHDTMLQSYVLNSAAGRHDLDSLALRELGRTTIHYEDVAGKGARQIPFSQVSIEAASRYAAEDAEVALALHHKLWPRLQAEPSLQRVYEEIEIPLVPVLARMERAGVKIDVDLLREHGRALAAELQDLEQKAYEEAGGPFNLASPKQLQEILYDKLKLPVARKTPMGQPSTAEDVLAELAENYRLPQLILAYRSLSKLKSTYIDKLPEQINPATGRVHTSYHQAVAATGRLSSSDPNLQNIPIRTAEGRRIRQAFVAPPGYRLLAADYSQIELRIMAHLSNDPGLLQAFANGEDVHRATAAEIFGVTVERVNADQRRSAKTINFGLIYGMSAFGLARQLGISREAAQRYVDRYFERYPGVRQFMEQTRAFARTHGYVETVFGRRLYVPDIQSRNAQNRQYAERTAINAPMQGTAADIIKRAMISIDAWLQQTDCDARMIMQVHDELVFEVAAAEAEQLRQAVVGFMCGAAQLSVPLEVESDLGANWDEAH